LTGNGMVGGCPSCDLGAEPLLLSAATHRYKLGHQI